MKILYLFSTCKTLPYRLNANQHTDLVSLIGAAFIMQSPPHEKILRCKKKKKKNIRSHYASK